MGELCQVHGNELCRLEAEHLIGRGSQCALRIGKPYISGQHAVIRWTGSLWQLIDRGSRNGTLLGGQRLEAGRAYDLEAGSTIAFGHPLELWKLENAGGPEVMMTSLSTGETVFGPEGSIVLPSAAAPRCMLFRVREGVWKLDHPERSPRLVEDGEIVELDGQLYRFSCPLAIGSTFNVDATEAPATLELRVSTDQEFVEASLRYPARKVHLGSRSHNYLLLLLAEARLADAATGMDPANSGWIYKSDLAKSLGTTPQQVDGEVFRIRAHFAQHRVEGASIIERRPRTTQLRIGIPDLEILRS